jgi:O-antigen ligase
VPDVIVLTLVARVLLLHPDDILPIDAIEGAAIAFGLWALLASVHGHSHLGAAVLELRDLLLFVVLYACVRRLRSVGDGLDGDFWPKVVPYALLAVGVVGAQALFQTFILGHGLLLPAKLAVDQARVVGVNAGRPYGWLNNPNVVGELGFLALVLAYDYFRSRAFRPAWLSGLTFAFFAAMVVLSFSRSAYIVVLVSAALFFFGARGRERAGIVALVLLMAVAVAAMPGARARAVFGRAPVAVAAAPVHHVHHVRHPHVRSHHGRSVTTTGRRHTTPATACGYLCTSSRAGRLHNFRVALHLARHHPFGTGLGTFGSAGALAFHVHLKDLPKNFYADNQYTVILVETGLPGALLFALLGLATFLAIFAMRDPQESQQKRLLLALFVSMVILGATSNAWEQLVLTLYPWLALAVFLPLRKSRGKNAVAPAGGGLPVANQGP